MSPVEFSGMEHVKDSFEAEKARQHCEKYYRECLKRHRRVDFFRVHLKVFHKEGKRKEFEANLMLGVSGTELNAHARGWIASKTVADAIENLERELEHHFKKARNF